VARITRKELKTDKFALEVGHTVDFFEEHRREALRYGAVALVVILIAAGVYFYRGRVAGERQQVLSGALQVLEAQVGPPSPGVLSFPTGQAREQAGSRKLTELAAKYPGSNEGVIAQYTLASMAADDGRLAEAEKLFKDAIATGNGPYGSLAKISLAQIYFASGRTAQGEELLRGLIDKPTVLVSREEATIALARGLARSKPIEARKLLDPLRGSRNTAVSQVAVQLYSEIPQ
jgi:predicted negative regulator of RcsB-dependent stress response